MAIREINLDAAAECMADMMAADIPALLISPPGVGKSKVTIQAIRRYLMTTGHFKDESEIGERKHGKRGIVDMRAALREAVDFSGLPDLQAEYTVWKSPDFLPRVERDGPVGALVLEEVTNAGKQTQGALYQLVLDRALNDYVLPPGWRILANGNSAKDRAAANPISSAFISRFAAFRVKAEIKPFVANAERCGFHPAVIDFIKWSEQRNESMLYVPAKEDAEPWANPRQWEAVSKFIKTARADNWRNGTAALVGDIAADSFMGFLEIWRTMPKLADVFRDPVNAAVPVEHGGRFAVACAVAREMTAANIGAAIVYLERCGSAWKAMALADAIDRDDSLTATAAYTNDCLKTQGRNF